MALLRNSRLTRDLPFPFGRQFPRTILVVPGALKRLMTEQANATGSRVPAQDAGLDFGGLALRVSCSAGFPEALLSRRLGARFRRDLRGQLRCDVGRGIRSGVSGMPCHSARWHAGFRSGPGLPEAGLSCV